MRRPARPSAIPLPHVFPRVFPAALAALPVFAAALPAAARAQVPAGAGPLPSAVAPAGTRALGSAPARTRPFANRLSVLGGLSQPLAFGGGNAEVQYHTSRWVAEYSHGWDLQLSDVRSALRPAERAQNLGVRMAWTTGGGVGPRLTNRLHATLDVKAHRVEAGLPGGEAVRYTTYTVGPAVGYVLPVWRGLVVQPVVRWWPNVGSSLDGGRASLRRADGGRFEHRVITQGPGGVNANVKLGWRF